MSRQSRRDRAHRAQLRRIVDRVHGSLRDLAMRFLDDPHAADRIARTVLLELRKRKPEELVDIDRVEEMLLDDLVTLCLERTGCPRAADFDYGDDEGEEKNEKKTKKNGKETDPLGEDAPPDTEPCPAPPAANDNGVDDESVA